MKMIEFRPFPIFFGPKQGFSISLAVLWSLAFPGLLKARSLPLQSLLHAGLSLAHTIFLRNKEREAETG